MIDKPITITKETILEAVEKLKEYNKQPNVLNLMASTETINDIKDFIPVKVESSGFNAIFHGLMVVKNELIPHKRMLINYDDGTCKIIDL